MGVRPDRELVESLRGAFEAQVRLHAAGQALVTTHGYVERSGYTTPSSSSHRSAVLSVVVIEALSGSHSAAAAMAEHLGLDRRGDTMGPGASLAVWVGWLPEDSRVYPTSVRLYAPAQVDEAELDAHDDQAPVDTNRGVR